MRYLKRIALLCLAATMLLSVTGPAIQGVLADAPTSSTDSAEYTTDPLKGAAGTLPGTESMVQVLDNGKLALYANVVTGEVAVVEKADNTVWFTNPPDRAEDTTATPAAQRKLSSQLLLTYHDKKANIYDDVTSFEECVEREQLSYRLIENGIEFNYVFGEFEESIIIPRWISMERMETYLAQMSEEDQKFVKRQYYSVNLDELRPSERAEYIEKYPIIEEFPIYALRENGEFRQVQLMEIFEPLGYTREDLMADNEETGYFRERTDAYFIVPLAYTLEDGELVVSIDAARVDFDRYTFPLSEITVLPYFGAAGKEEEGYILVPDGSGALIRLNNGKTGTGQYVQSVYGTDATYELESSLEADDSRMIRMPVYGMKRGDHAFFTVIESGEALAEINANIAGKTDAYNFVNAKFTVLPNSEISIGTVMDETNKLFMYAEKAYQGAFSQRYSFLSGDDADYVGMAEEYRAYLIENDLLSDLDLSHVPFFLNTIGAVNVQRTFMGINYNTTERLTTFAQAQELAKSLLDGGVKDLSLRYSGWYNGGLEGAPATSIKEVSGLKKGDVDLDDLQEWLTDNGVKGYFDVDFQYAYKDGLFDGVSNRWFVKFLDKSVANLNKYSLSTYLLTEKVAKLIRPSQWNVLAENVVKTFDKKELTGVSLGSLANEVYSDFTQKGQANRQQATDMAVETIQTLKDGGLAVLGENAGAYALKGLSGVVDVPLYSNAYALLDEDVPFYQLVLHGYLPYAGEALNLADDYRETWLRSVESGAGLQVCWIYAENSVLKDTEYTRYYAVNYEIWMEEALDLYTRMESDLGRLQEKKIVDHEILSDSVRRVTYEDGTAVWINYNKEPAVIEGKTIPALDYLVTGGDEA